MSLRTLLKLVCLTGVAFGVAFIAPWAFVLYTDPASNSSGQFNEWVAEVPDSWPTPVSRGRTSNFGVDISIEYTSRVRGWREGPWGGRLLVDDWLVETIKAGVPFRSHMCFYGSGPGETISRGVAEAPERWRRSGGFQHVPTAIDWVAVTANATCYVAAMLVGIRGPWLVRRFLRRRGGRCLACGYIVEQLPRCPECGEDRMACRGD